MPLIQIRRNIYTIRKSVLEAVVNNLPDVAAFALTCAEGGVLTAKDIMIEVSEVSPHDRNMKDISLLVWAHDYHERRGEKLMTLNGIRERISHELIRHLPNDASWSVWVLLAATSYGSNTGR